MSQMAWALVIINSAMLGKSLNLNSFFFGEISKIGFELKFFSTLKALDILSQWHGS